MKHRFTITIIFLLASCKSSPDKQEHALADSTASVQKLCFLSVSGSTMQDTAILRLRIEGEQVEGEFENRIYEKDARKGTISGELRNKVIKGTWHYMQEGKQDSLPVAFLLSDGKLMQKNYTIDPETGTELFLEGEPFSIQFEKTNCPD